MAPWGTEVILGSINTPTFGPTIMFGLGGIFVEILKDVTFRIAPVSKEQALRMLVDIKGAAILQGTRGETPRDLDVLADVLSRYSQMIYDLGEEILESDANPVIVYAKVKGLRSSMPGYSERKMTHDAAGVVLTHKERRFSRYDSFTR